MKRIVLGIFMYALGWLLLLIIILVPTEPTLNFFKQFGISKNGAIGCMVTSVLLLVIIGKGLIMIPPMPRISKPKSV